MPENGLHTASKPLNLVDRWQTAPTGAGVTTTQRGLSPGAYTDG